MSDPKPTGRRNSDGAGVPDDARLKRVRERVNGVADFLEEKAFRLLPQSEKEQFEHKLQSILAELERRPNISVALLGSSGVGKSTLLNALVGVPILSEDDRRFCTAAVTILRYSSEPGFRARLTFSSLEQWERELNACKNELEALQEEVGEEQDLESKELFRYYREKLRVVYGLGPEESIDFSALVLPEDLRSRMVKRNEPLVLKHDEVREFKAQLKEYVTSKGRYWPLIQTVEIEGSFDALRNGVELVDLPGVNDPNPAREEITRQYLRSAPHIWLIFHTRRGLTKDVRDFMFEPDLLRQFLMEGKVDTLTLVGTHAESVDANEEVLREYGLDPDAPADRLIRVRNAEVVRDVSAALGEIAEAVADRAGEGVEGRQNLQKRLGRSPIFTVASKDYQKLRKITRGGNPPVLTEPETQIPDLIHHLARLAEGQDIDAHAAEIEKRLDLFIKDVQFFFRSWREQLSTQGDGDRRRRDALRERCKNPKEKLRLRLNEVVETANGTFEARRELFSEKLGGAVEKSKKQLGEVISNWNQMHWATLRATVSRDGSFVSPSSGRRYNLNEDVCRPLLDSIPFAWDDFFGAQLDKLLAVSKEKLEGHADLFIAELQIEALKSHLVEVQSTEAIQSELDAAKESLALQINSAKAALEQTIRQTRQDLSGNIAVTISSVMAPAYEQAKRESGRGLKQRIIALLHHHAHASVTQMFDTVQRDLSEGVGILGGQLGSQLGRLEEYVLQQAERVVQNLVGDGIDTTGINLENTLKSVESTMTELDRHPAFLRDTSPRATVQI